LRIKICQAIDVGRSSLVRPSCVRVKSIIFGRKAWVMLDADGATLEQSASMSGLAETAATERDGLGDEQSGGVSEGGGFFDDFTAIPTESRTDQAAEVGEDQAGRDIGEDGDADVPGEDSESEESGEKKEGKSAGSESDEVRELRDKVAKLEADYAAAVRKMHEATTKAAEAAKSSSEAKADDAKELAERDREAAFYRNVGLQFMELASPDDGEVDHQKIGRFLYGLARHAGKHAADEELGAFKEKEFKPLNERVSPLVRKTEAEILESRALEQIKTVLANKESLSILRIGESEAARLDPKAVLAEARRQAGIDRSEFVQSAHFRMAVRELAERMREEKPDATLRKVKKPAPGGSGIHVSASDNSGPTDQNLHIKLGTGHGREELF
jgi:hypothetical protein